MVPRLVASTHIIILAGTALAKPQWLPFAVALVAILGGVQVLATYATDKSE